MGQTNFINCSKTKIQLNLFLGNQNKNALFHYRKILRYGRYKSKAGYDTFRIIKLILLYGTLPFVFRRSPLVKAHIVPEAFFRVLREGGETPLLVSNSKGTYTKRSPIGVYDRGILCKRCEALFSEVDGYGAYIFLNKFEEIFQPINNGGITIALEAHDIDQELLLRFLVATLWRASVSTQSFYGRVCLRGLESEAAKVILAPTQPISPLFSAVLAIWASNKEGDFSTQGIMSPFRERWGSVNAYRFYFGRIIAYVKASNQAFGPPFSNFNLNKHPVCRVLVRKFETSKDFASMVNLVKESRDRREV